MTRAKLNSIVEELSGQMGDVVFRRRRGGGMSLIRKADMSTVQNCVQSTNSLPLNRANEPSRWRYRIISRRRNKPLQVSSLSQLILQL